jgi:hypothetical protein
MLLMLMLLFMLMLQLLLSGLTVRWSSGPGQRPGNCSSQSASSAQQQQPLAQLQAQQQQLVRRMLLVRLQGQVWASHPLLRSMRPWVFIELSCSRFGTQRLAAMKHSLATASSPSKRWQGQHLAMIMFISTAQQQQQQREAM